MLRLSSFQRKLESISFRIYNIFLDSSFRWNDEELIAICILGQTRLLGRHYCSLVDPFNNPIKFERVAFI